jgi:hypothetical protein
VHLGANEVLSNVDDEIDTLVELAMGPCDKEEEI